MASDPDEKERLRALVARVLEEIETEGLAALERSCREHPELSTPLRQRISALQRIGLVRLGADPADPFPERLGDFKLLRRLGSGGMGVVYLAEQVSLKRLVALKLIRPELLYFPGARNRFHREVEAVAKLNHPGIVPVYSVDDGGDIPYFAMERIDGLSLDVVLRELHARPTRPTRGSDLAETFAAALARETPGPEATATASAGRDAHAGGTAGSYVDACLRLVREAALALQHAHERGVIHRDLKPSNLMLTRDLQVRLVDFGLARTEGSHRITHATSQLGSLPYMAPEQVAGGVEAVTMRSDVYALGVVLFELLTREPAYYDRDPETTRRRILAGDRPSLRALNPDVAWDAETVCATAMERDPERRYASAADFARDLDHLLRFEPIAAKRASPALRLQRFAQRRPALAVGLTLGSLLLIGGPTIWAVQERRHGKKLEETNGALALANADLSAAHVTIEEQLVTEKQARESAVRSSRRARQAVIEFLGKVGGEMLRNTPGAETLRRDLLKRATEQFEQILAESDFDPEAWNEVAGVFRLLGRRYFELGDIAQARKAYERGLDLVGRVRAEAPENAAGMRAFADLLTERTLISIERENDAATVLTDIETAIPLYRDLLARGEIVLEVRTQLGTALSVRGQALALLDRNDESVAAFEEAVEFLTTATPPDRRPEAMVQQIIILRTNLAVALHRADRIDESEEVYHEVLDDLAHELERAPRDVFRREMAAAAADNLGALLVNDDRREEAEPYLRSAIDYYEALVKDFPQDARHRRGLPLAQRNLVEALVVLRGLDDPEVAALLEKAAFALGPLVAAGSNADPPARIAFIQVQRRLGALAFAAGRVPEGRAHLAQAGDVAQQLLRANAEEAEYHQLLASVERVYARAPAGAMADDERRTHVERAWNAACDAARHCRPRAIDPLSRSELLGAFDDLARLAKKEESLREQRDAAAALLQELMPGDPQALKRARK